MEKENLRPVDLMVGDWVLLFDKTPVKVDCIGNVEVYLTEPKGQHELDWRVTYEHIKPIPLTQEILEKNGFEKLDFSHYHINNRALVLDADGKWDGPLSWHWVVTEMDTNAKGQRVVLDYYVATIKYVHELQHALRLCGIDKEIVL